MTCSESEGQASQGRTDRPRGNLCRFVLIDARVDRPRRRQRSDEETGECWIDWAGNSNDLDLKALLSVHREVHLVDIDSEALLRNAERQGTAKHPRLHLHGGVDLTATLGARSDRTPLSELGPADLEAMAARPASRAAVVLPGGFDRAASTCLLSQILETAAYSFGRDHRQLAEAQAALRAGYLRLMAGLAAPGGDAVLVTEVVSSLDLPELPALDAKERAGLLPG